MRKRQSLDYKMARLRTRLKRRRYEEQASKNDSTPHSVEETPKPDFTSHAHPLPSVCQLTLKDDPSTSCAVSTRTKIQQQEETLCISRDVACTSSAVARQMNNHRMSTRIANRPHVAYYNNTPGVMQVENTGQETFQMPRRTRGRKRVSADTRHRRSRELRRKQQLALKKELRLFPTKNRLLLPRPAGHCEPAPLPLTQVVSIGSAGTVESGGSSRIPKATAANKVYLLGRNGVPFPAVVATALSNQIKKPSALKFMPPLIFRKPVQETPSKKFTSSPNPVVESGQPVEEIQVKVELCGFLFHEKIPREEDDLETKTEKKTPLCGEEESSSLDTELLATREDIYSEENGNSLIVKGEENYDSLIIKEEENDSSLIVKEENQDSSFIVEEEENDNSLIIKKEENPLDFTRSSSTSPGRTVNELENVQSQDVSYPPEVPISRDQINVNGSVLMDTAEEVEEVEFRETETEGPADAVDQNTVSSYLFVEADMSVKNGNYNRCCVDESSSNSAYQSDDVDPLCNKVNPNYSEENLWSCSICRAHFRYEGTLELHLKRHAADDHVCIICNERFFDKTTLRNHLVIHKNEDNLRYPCADCDERFAKVKDLVEHCKIHKSDPFKCTKCEASFRSYQSLGRHVASHAPKQFGCFLCKDLFHSKTVLNSHLRNQHSKNGGLHTWKSWEAWKNQGSKNNML